MMQVDQLKERIFNDFKFHPATEVTGPIHEDIRAQLRIAAGFIYDNTPPGREQSLALTKIEEAMFWANAAIARHGAPPLPQETA